ETSVRANAISDSRSSSIAPSSAVGQSLRCTESVDAARLRYISSLTNGQNGARSCASTVRTSWSVACALASDDFQKRGRDRRTYQFERWSAQRARAREPVDV